MPAPDSRPDYCPFCGARLRDETEPLWSHLDDSEECARRFDAWEPNAHDRPGRRASVGESRLLRSAVRVLLVILIIAYSLLIVQQPLLGIIAAALVYLLTHVGTIIDALRTEV